ncbi:NSFL1 cofactor p47-like [Montipora foliosa]|uniref:NSFL1 cofactor p47-like n=1 Tax=Montipora foliosa TaxID=591990 RepID=UPI0035F1BE09
MADESEKSRLIAEFSGVTDVDTERARFYLESARWDLHIAISNFFDTMGEEDVNIGPEPTEQAEELPSLSPKRQPQGRPGRNIASLASMHAEENSDSEEEEGQAFYAGGSERSGQQILGPARRKQPSDDVTQSIFDDAKRHGAEVVGDQDIAGPSVQPRPVFKGAGYRLGDTPGVDSQPLPETVSSTSSYNPPEQKEVALKFWSNGFSVDDGPLRSFDDPSNEQFLSSVRKGEIPQELRGLSRRNEVHVNMEDHRHEDYIPPPKPKMEAFSGAGHKLGSPVPEVRVRHQPTQDSPATVNSQSAAVPSPIDESKPVTSIQIRLADGTRMVSKFNHTNTVGDIRRFICASRPQMATRNFVLLLTFPNKELTDEGQTLAQANLLNAVIVQRFK